MKTYTLLTAGAKMPSSCMGIYKRIGIVEHDENHTPTQIRDTKKQRIIETWEKLSVGKTERCAFQIALKDAQKKLEKLNK